MNQLLFPPVIRNMDADDYFENFFVFSILSIVGIRIFLHLTGYPQLGGGGFHIAHMLWGGLLMMVALFLFFFFLNKALHQLGSILGGIGFGTFIDELGKFITADNNYFYQPTFSLIYIIFVLLYLSFHIVRIKSNFTQVEYLANAVEATKEVLIHDFDADEKQKALRWLSKADPNHQYTKAFYSLIDQEKPAEVQTSWIGTVRAYFYRLYRYLVSMRWVRLLALIFFLIQAVGYITLMALFVVYRVTGRSGIPQLRLDFFGAGLLGSSAIAVGILIFGLMFMLTSSRRARAYRFFRYSLLTNITLVTFFAFYFSPVITLVNVMVNIVFLKTFEYAQSQERTAQMKR